MEEAENLSDEVFLQDAGKIIESGTVKKLLKRFSGKIRVESQSPLDGSTMLGGMHILYDIVENAEKHVKNGANVKKITLDDLFIMRGVDLEY